MENSESETEEPVLQGELRDEIYDSDLEVEVGDRSEDELIDEHEQPSNLISERPRCSVNVQNDFVEQITDVREWLKTPWVIEDDNITNVDNI